MLIEPDGKRPTVADSAYVAPTAVLTRGYAERFRRHRDDRAL